MYTTGTNTHQHTVTHTHTLRHTPTSGHPHAHINKHTNTHQHTQTYTNTHTHLHTQNLGGPNYNVGRNTQFLSEQEPGHSDQSPRSNIDNFIYLYNHVREARPNRVGYHGVVDQPHYMQCRDKPGQQGQYPGGNQPYSKEGEGRGSDTPFRYRVEAPKRNNGRENWGSNTPYRNKVEVPKISPSYEEEKKGRGRRRSRSHGTPSRMGKIKYEKRYRSPNYDEEKKGRGRRRSRSHSNRRFHSHR